MGVKAWLNRVLGLGYGQEALLCPRCGGHLVVRLTVQAGEQGVTCPYCKKGFRLAVRPGHVSRTEIPADDVAV